MVAPQDIHIGIILVLTKLRISTVVVEDSVSPACNPVIVICVVVCAQFISGWEVDAFLVEKSQKKFQLFLLSKLILTGKVLILEGFVFVEGSDTSGFLACHIQPVVHVSE